MTDKEKIRKEVERMHNLLPIMDGDNISINYADRICTTLEMYIDSLQEEPVSEDLEEAADNALSNVLNTHEIINIRSCLEMFRYGAKWQKEQLIDKACEWLKSYRQEIYDGIAYIAGIVNDKTIEDFRSAMKG